MLKTEDPFQRDNENEDPVVCSSEPHNMKLNHWVWRSTFSKSVCWFSMHDFMSFQSMISFGVYTPTCLWYTVTVTTNRSHYKMLYKGSKWQQIWLCAKPNVIQCMHYWGISSLSEFWTEDLNLTGRGSGRWASAHAPTFDDLINFWWSTNLFLLDVLAQ